MSQKWGKREWANQIHNIRLRASKMWKKNSFEVHNWRWKMRWRTNAIKQSSCIKFFLFCPRKKGQTIEKMSSVSSKKVTQVPRCNEDNYRLNSKVDMDYVDYAKLRLEWDLVHTRSRWRFASFNLWRAGVNTWLIVTVNKPICNLIKSYL